MENPFRDIQRPNSNLPLVRFYCVRFILQQDNGDENSPAWILVSPVVQIPNEDKYEIDESAKLICIELTTSVRRVGKMHFCTENCKYAVVERQLSVRHDETNMWNVLDARAGFPPNMG